MERHQRVAPVGTGRLRILHVSDVYLPRVGGIELNVSDLAAQQQAAGHHVEVVTLSKPGEAQPNSPGAIEVHRPDGPALAQRAAAMWRYRDLGARLGFDVVHCHCSTFSPLAFTTVGAARGTNAAVGTVMTVHSLWRYYTPLYTAVDAAIAWSRWPVVWSAVSRAAADAVARAALRPLEVHVAPNGIDLSTWAVAPWQPADRHVRFASVMRLAARKRPIPLLRMFREVRRRVPADIRLSAVVIGDGPSRDAMARYIDKHDLDWVELPGRLPRPEVAQQLAAADVYVAPARLESFGIAALEARAVGLPVVGRTGTGLADFIADGRDGALCGDDDGMVRAMAQLAREPGRYRRRPHEVGQLERLAWPSVVAGTDALYARALEIAPGADRGDANRSRFPRATRRVS